MTIGNGDFGRQAPLLPPLGAVLSGTGCRATGTRNRAASSCSAVFAGGAAINEIRQGDQRRGPVDRREEAGVGAGYGPAEDDE